MKRKDEGSFINASLMVSPVRATNRRNVAKKTLTNSNSSRAHHKMTQHLSSTMESIKKPVSKK